MIMQKDSARKELGSHLTTGNPVVEYLGDGCIALSWQEHDANQRWITRTFTQDETSCLLDFLYNHRDEILGCDPPADIPAWCFGDEAD